MSSDQGRDMHSIKLPDPYLDWARSPGVPII
jgi:hypothetical protein